MSATICVEPIAGALGAEIGNVDLSKPLAGETVAAIRRAWPAGGDTLFANMYLAYETLSDGMKRLLENLIAVNSSANADVTKTREDRMKDRARADSRTEYVAEHPVVRVHPETGRKALYVNIAHTVAFEGMTREESAPINDYHGHRRVRHAPGDPRRRQAPGRLSPAAGGTR